jgi:hypothetical protein
MLISQELYIFLCISSILGLTLGLISTIIGSIALIRVIASEKSTHTVHYAPIDEEIDRANKEYMENWATKESAIAKDQKQFKEDLENEMPDFFPDEEDSKIHSF